MNQIKLYDFLALPIRGVSNPKLINVRGGNGSGKSTIPALMLESDPDSFEVIWKYKNRRESVICTVSPKYKFVIIGHYRVKSGGLDTLVNNQEMIDAVKVLWRFKYHILMEGILASSLFKTYADFFKEMETQEYRREVIIYNLVPPYSFCLDRIKERNGGKEVNLRLFQRKYNAVKANVQKFIDAGFKTIEFDTSTVARKDMLSEFLKRTSILPKKVSKPLFLPKEHTFSPIQGVTIDVNEFSTKKVYIEPKENLKAYDWYEDYIEPNRDLEVYSQYFDNYWYFIAERMNIWYERVKLQKESPWTSDKILQTFKFTNVIRDLDRLSIYERKNILMKIDAPTANLELRKKSVLLNIMVFRLWVKIDTYESIGFLDLEDPHFYEKWELGKKHLLERKERGESNFTAAFWINNLRVANPDPLTKTNKTMNAICMIESWIQNIDEIYRDAILNSRGMLEQMEVFKRLKGIGDFTAYEYACSIAEITRYCKNTLVAWTQDNATNVGIGARRGIYWIFKNMGGMTEYQCLLYLRSIWKHELKKRGYYERFMAQLPEEMNGDIDLRVIEHCLCETQKYNKALTNTGRPKVNFSPKSVEELR